MSDQSQPAYALRLDDAELSRYRIMAQRAQHDEREFWHQVGIVAGATVADVGCGPGAISAALAESVGATGSVWAVERDPRALDHARAFAARSGIQNITFVQASATETGLPARSVDVVMMRHVLAHNGGQEQAIVDHLASLVRSGGAVYLVDVEASGIRYQPSIPELEDLWNSYLRLHQRWGNDLSVGLRLAELLAAAGLEGVEHHGRYHIVPLTPGFRPPPWAARDAIVEAGIADAAAVGRWQGAFSDLDSGALSTTAFIPQFIAWGRRPR